MIELEPISRVGAEQARADSPVNAVQYHTHNGIDSPLLDLSNLPTGGDVSATFVIGPSSNSDSAGYDYVTDGTNDDVEIQAAIDALPSSGGRIVFREGTYTLGSATVTIAKNGVTLQGQGKGSIITCATNYNVSFFTFGHASTQYTNCVVKDFYFNGNESGQTSGDYIIDNFTSTVSVSNLLVEGCYFTASEIASVVCKSNTLNMTVRSCTFENWKAGTFAVEADNQMRIIDCYFVTTSTTGKCINGEALITSCEFSLPASYNTTAIASADSIHNSMMTTGATPGSNCILLDDVETVTGCNLIFGSNANASAITLRNCEIVTGCSISGRMLYTTIEGTIIGNTIGANEGDYTLTLNRAGNFRTRIIGNWFGTADTGTILITGGTAQNNIIANNYIPSANGGYGIRENSSTDGPNMITGNIMAGTATVTNRISTQHLGTEVSHNLTI